VNAIVKGALLGAAAGGIGAGVRARQSGAPGPEVQASALKGAAGGAVVGIGIGFLIHRRGVARLAEAAQPVLEAAAEAAVAAGEAARTRAEELAEAARSGATSVAHTAAERAGEVASSAGGVARSRGGELAEAVRSRAASAAESARPVISAAA